MSDERECPGPLHTSRDPWPAGMPVPGPCARLVKGAEAAGWDAWCTYAQGFALPVKLADPAYIVDTVAVRFRRGGRGGWVVYHNRGVKWEAKSLMVFGGDHWPVVTGLGVEDVVRYLIEDWTGAEVAAWATALKVKKAEADARARETAKAKRLKVGKGKVI